VTSPAPLDVARWLQSRLGLAVFAVDHPGQPNCVGAHRPERPCDGTRGKHPCGKWSRMATTDPHVIRAQLSDGLRNLGIACKQSRLLVIDEDRPGAFDAYASEIGQTLEPTFTVTTAKGQHRYYWQPDGSPLGNGTGALSGRGIDVRGAQGNGGYVVAPGSVHETGILYAPVDSSAPILPAPAWLVSALQQPRPTAPVQPRPRPQLRGASKPYKVLTALVQVVMDAQPSNRNNTLYWAACRMHEHARSGLFDASAGRAALLDAARHIGLSDGESEMTIDSADRAAAMGGAA
jgi:hypothetical protein